MQKKALGLISLAAVSALFGTAAAATGDAYTWPTYRSDLDYDTKSNIGVISAPTKFSTDCDGVTGQKAGQWWAFYWGANRDSRVTDETIDSLLKKYDTDFAYLRDTMGWAPDRRAQAGYYSAVYYYGSGTCAGGTTSDTTGGWQTNIGTNYYEAVAASLYPVYSFNPKCPYSDRVSQMDAMVHEGIHSMTKAYPGATNAHWFQEGGNTWIQQEMAARRNPNETWHSGMGFLNAGAVIAPFIPIESYSGWLLDGSFGGPNADGVGVYSGSTQLCNWRNLLGGYQYGNVFPTFLGEWVGKGAVRWLYGNAYGETNYLLETFALSKGLGADNTRRLIMEYRARLALLDMKKWSENMRTLLNDNFGSSASAEWTPSNGSPAAWTMTPYQTMTTSGEWLVPESRTTPGWSGANIVPLTVSSGATSATVTFKPLGDNMTIQLCYRKTDGTPVYSEPLTGVTNGNTGTVTLNLSNVQSGVIFAVICNTDYQYTGNESIRQNHYNYNIKLTSGLSGAASPNTKWYNNFVLSYSWPELGDSYSPNISSSSVASSSSSSSIAVSSSSSEVATTLTKCGGGSSNQTVEAGNAITEFCYTWTNATGVTYTGFPDGITATIDYSNKKITINGTVGASVAAQKYSFTVSTTGGSTTATKSGSITVTKTSSSSSSVQSSSSIQSSSSAKSSSSVAPVSSSSAVQSSSSVAPVSSSSSLVASSSSETQASSSSQTIAAVTITKDIAITLPIDDNYATVKASFNSDEVASALGLTASTLSNATFFAQEPSGNIVTTTNTDALGHWFDRNGNVINWGDSAMVFSDVDLTNATVSVGHYPNHVSNGDVFTIKQGLSYNGNTVLFVITITITNDSGNGDITNTLMYGLNGPAKHVSVAYSQGLLTVNYTLSHRDNVKISLFSGYGALLTADITKTMNTGKHQYSIDLRDLPTGTYIVKVTTGSYREAKSITICK